MTALTHHLAKSPRCKQLHENELNRTLKRKRTGEQENDTDNAPQTQRTRLSNAVPDEDLCAEQPYIDAQPVDPDSNNQGDQDDLDAQPPTRQHATVEDVLEDPAVSTRYWHQEFPTSYKAGLRGERSRTTFDRIRDDQVLRGGEVWGPFEDERQWEVVKWLIRNVGRNSAESFLKLAAVRTNHASIRSRTWTHF